MYIDPVRMNKAVTDYTIINKSNKSTYYTNSRDIYDLNFYSDYDYLMKLVLVGNCYVGKSALMKRYIDDEYMAEPYISTIGVDFCIKRIELDNSDSKIKFELNNNNNNTNNIIEKKYVVSNPFKVKLQIWDTAGREKYRSITQSYYYGMNMCILCFDATKDGYNGSINNVTKWLDDIERLTGSDIRVYVIGTKIDCRNMIYSYDNLSYIDHKIQEIEKYTNMDVNFWGWCSSKNDIFIRDIKDIEHIVSVADNYYWSADKIKECPELKGKHVLNIQDMISEISSDYLRKEITLSNHTRIHVHDIDDESIISNNKQRVSCCIIL